MIKSCGNCKYYEPLEAYYRSCSKGFESPKGICRYVSSHNMPKYMEQIVSPSAFLNCPAWEPKEESWKSGEPDV